MLGRHLDPEDKHKIKEIDRECKEKFKWEWLDKKVEVEIKGRKMKVKLGDCLRKTETPGVVVCTFCSNKTVKYASKGVTALTKHVQCASHQTNMTSVGQTHTLNNHFSTPSSSQSSSSVPSTTAVQPLPALMCDRVSTAEATLLAFTAEHNLPMDMTRDLATLCATMANDKKSLSELKLGRTAVGYKLQHGLGQYFHEETIANIKLYPFSLNLDESTSSANNKRVLSILVSYYNPYMETVVVEHLHSVELFLINSEIIYDVLVQFFSDNGIPWGNLVSMLMDSCNVMRGSKTGFETRIRQQKASHLLDIDGDSCHHIHNSCKVFIKPFEYHVEELVKSLHTDNKWAADQRRYLEEICEMLNITFVVPPAYIPHRWLSIHDVALATLQMYEAYYVLYYGSLSADMRAVYKAPFNAIIKNCSNQQKNRIQKIHQLLAKKSLTDDGKKRKTRIFNRLIFKQTKTRLILNTYIAVLPSLKAYNKLFQGSTTLIHKVHDEQLQLFKDFLAFFIKPEHIIGKPPKSLLGMPIDKDSNTFLRTRDMFVGGVNDILIKNLHKDDLTLIEYRKQLSAAYKDTAIYLQKKLPLNSKTLKSLSCLDPCIRSHTRAKSGLSNLADKLNHLLPHPDSFSLELTRFQVDESLCQYDGQDITGWWTSVFKTNRYPLLSTIAKACLSIFHGPMVESSFSVMNNIMDKKRSKLSIQSYGSYQNIKYGLRARNSTSMKFLARENIKYSPVNKNLCILMRSASSKCKAKQKKHNEIVPSIATRKSMVKRLKRSSPFGRKSALEDYVAVRAARKQKKN